MTARSCLVIGSTRGIGKALVHELLEQEQYDHVYATHRSDEPPDSLQKAVSDSSGSLVPLQLDVCDTTSLERFRHDLSDKGDAIELVIHAAGFLHDKDIQPEKSVDQCNPEDLLRYFQVNSIGPLMVARAVLANQTRKSRLVFAALSAMVGSIGDNRRGGWYGYRSSKAALNQFIRTLANECRWRHPGAAMVAIHPGTTDTGLSEPFQKNISPEKLYSPGQTAKRILSVLDNLDADDSGRFFNWDGTEIPW